MTAPDKRIAPLHPLYRALLAAGLALPGLNAAAATATWIGSIYGCSAYLSCGASWLNGIRPRDMDNLIFNSSYAGTIYNDALTQTGSITFADKSQALTLTGSVLMASATIINRSAYQQTLNMPLYFLNFNAGSNEYRTIDGGTAGLVLGNAYIHNFNGLNISGKVTFNQLQSNQVNATNLKVNANAELTAKLLPSTRVALNLKSRNAKFNNLYALTASQETLIELDAGASFIDQGSAGTNQFGPINGSGGKQVITLDGGAQWLSSRDMRISPSFSSQGNTLRLSNNSYMRTGNFSFGPGAYDSKIDLFNSTLQANGDMQHGAQVTTTIMDGQLLVAGRLSAARGSEIRLYGGKLSAASYDIQGDFNWQNGTLGYTGIDGTRLGEGLLSSNLTLSQGWRGLEVSGTLVVGAGTSLDVRDDMLATGKLGLRGGTLLLSDQALARNTIEWSAGSLTLTGNGNVATSQLLGSKAVLNQGDLIQTAGTLIIDAGSSLSVNGGVLSANQIMLNGGAFSLLNDSSVTGALTYNSGALTLGSLAGASLGGTYLKNDLQLVQGDQLTVTHNLAIGKGSSLTVNGGQLRAGTLVLDGGTLTAHQDLGKQNLLWKSGNIYLAGNAGATLGSGLFSNRTVVLDREHGLEVANTLTVGRGANLVLDGGHFKTGALALEGGRVIGALDLNTIQSLQGYGMVSGAISGDAQTRISARGGVLMLGDAFDSKGYAFQGTLEVGQNQVWLFNEGKASLGTLTTMEDGGQLYSNAGLMLEQGNRLISTGNTSIYGQFDNHGSVFSNGGTLSFYDNVTGTGSFSGQTLFRAGYNPGADGERAVISFAGGSASYDSNAILTMDILGSGNDQLSGISTLNFNGTLHLVFADHYQFAPGGPIKLFDFQHFSGQFDSDHIVVEGYDKRQLDFSRLGKDGVISVSAVPEPASYAMLIGGLGLLALRRRRSAV